jgi:hypothetical protein
MEATNLGKMPPKQKPRPDSALAFALVKWVAAQMTHSEKVAMAAKPTGISRSWYNRSYWKDTTYICSADANI